MYFYCVIRLILQCKAKTIQYERIFFISISIETCRKNDQSTSDSELLPLLSCPGDYIYACIHYINRVLLIPENKWANKYSYAKNVCILVQSHCSKCSMPGEWIVNRWQQKGLCKDGANFDIKNIYYIYFMENIKKTIFYTSWYLNSLIFLYSFIVLLCYLSNKNHGVIWMRNFQQVSQKLWSEGKHSRIILFCKILRSISCFLARF